MNDLNCISLVSSLVFRCQNVFHECLRVVLTQKF